MKKIWSFLLLTTITCSAASAQSLPINTCGVVYTYDAAGNRTQRAYLCNNGSGDSAALQRRTAQLSTDIAAEPVSALYPNPTTGRFRISFTNPLKEAQCFLLDQKGNVLQQRKANGSLIDIDVSGFPAGMYYIKIRDKQTDIMYKVIKL